MSVCLDVCVCPNICVHHVYISQRLCTLVTICMLHESLSLWVSVYFSIYRPVSVHFSVCCFTVCESKCLWVSMFLYVLVSVCSVSVSYCLCFPVSAYYCISLSFRFLCYSLCTPAPLCLRGVYPSVCVSQVLYIPLSVYPSVCVYQYLYSSIWSHCLCVPPSLCVLTSVLVFMCIKCLYVSVFLVR